MGCGGGSDGSSGDKVALVTMVLVVVVSHMQGHAQNSRNRPSLGPCVVQLALASGATTPSAYLGGLTCVHGSWSACMHVRWLHALIQPSGYCCWHSNYRLRAHRVLYWPALCPPLALCLLNMHITSFIRQHGSGFDWFQLHCVRLS